MGPVINNSGSSITNVRFSPLAKQDGISKSSSFSSGVQSFHTHFPIVGVRQISWFWSTFKMSNFRKLPTNDSISSHQSLALDYRGASDWSSNYTHVVLTAIFLRQQVAPRKSIENLMSRFGATFFFLQKLCAPNFTDCAKSIKLFYDGLCP